MATVSYECTQTCYRLGVTYNPGDPIELDESEKPGSHHKPTDAASLAVYKKHFPPGTPKSAQFSDYEATEVVKKEIQQVAPPKKEEDPKPSARPSDSPPA